MSLKAALALALLGAAACGRPASEARGKRVIVLAVDGMDPRFVEAHWDALPNLRRLRDIGGIERLATTTPPQSPVAWSTFITGTDPERHGIFDFVSRDPSTLAPLSSMAETLEPVHRLRLGPYVIPLSKARVRSFRRGRAFWETLAAHGIPVTVIRMPTNYPPVECEGYALAGMGTPDLRGTFGTFTFYTDDPAEIRREVSGGLIVPVTRRGGRVTLPLEGPPNTLRSDRRPASLDTLVDIDPDAPVARFQAGGQEFILRQGEWSPWVRVRFPLIPGLAGVSGMFRVYAKELRPNLRIYVSPLNVDPADPALPLSAPAGYSRELAARIGPFYTQGIEEDTSALRQGVLDLREYLEQSRFVSSAHAAMLRDCLNRFRDGFLFFYFSEIDQDSHVLWGRHEPELLATYQAVDGAVGEVLQRAGDATVIVMSDHGFAAFDRSVNLNTWLWQEGFLALDNPRNAGAGEWLAHVNWEKTKAYAVGLNALYLNLAGRDRHGIVHTGDEAAAVLRDIGARLRQFRDPDTGASVIAEVTPVAQGGTRLAPDLIVGYAPGYRASWDAALGTVGASVLDLNTDAWIGDHCMAAEAVPGVLLANRKPRAAAPRLKDITVTILKEFGVVAPPQMDGRPVY